MAEAIVASSDGGVLVGLILIAGLYFLPTIVAVSRKAPNPAALCPDALLTADAEGASLYLVPQAATVESQTLLICGRPLPRGGKNG